MPKDPDPIDKDTIISLAQSNSLIIFFISFGDNVIELSPSVYIAYPS
jgi:hypothetical protein